jgi:hypothetical protein
MNPLPLLACLTLVATAATQPAPHKKKPVVRVRKAPQKPVVPVPVQDPADIIIETEATLAATPAPLPRNEATMAAFGTALIESPDGLLATDVRPGSAAEAMGLRAGDLVWRVDRATPRTLDDAAAARLSTIPEERESLVVLRGLESLALTGRESPVPPDFSRGPSDLSIREKSLADARSKRDVASAREIVAQAPALDWTLKAEQSVWVRFPIGLPSGLSRGDIFEAEVATGLTTDTSLDFLAIPPKSRLWARVIEASDDGSVRTVRLVFYKMRPAEGRIYPMLGVATALADVESAQLKQVSAGGTLIVGSPLPFADGKKKTGKDLLLDEDARLRVRLLTSAIIAEPPSWWRAGPGLWLKATTTKEGHRRFEVTHVITGRSAAVEGLNVGDILDEIGGRSTEKIDLMTALDMLYGTPGSKIKVSVIRSTGSKTLELTRGTNTSEKGVTTRIPLPFEAR